MRGRATVRYMSRKIALAFSRSRLMSFTAFCVRLICSAARASICTVVTCWPPRAKIGKLIEALASLLSQLFDRLDLRGLRLLCLGADPLGNITRLLASLSHHTAELRWHARQTGSPLASAESRSCYQSSFGDEALCQSSALALSKDHEETRSCTTRRVHMLPLFGPLLGWGQSPSGSNANQRDVNQLEVQHTV